MVPKLLLLNAEIDGLVDVKKANLEKIRKTYDAAIVAASRAGFVQDAALANERAGVCFLDLGDEFWAQTYIVRARSLCYDWGARGKVKAIVREHLKFFADEKTDQITKATDEDMSQSAASRSKLSSNTDTFVDDATPSSNFSRNASQKLSSRSTSHRGVQKFDPRVMERHGSVTFDPQQQGSSLHSFGDSGSFPLGAGDSGSFPLGTRVPTTTAKAHA